jgi:type 1 glutamine amidotransferase
MRIAELDRQSNCLVNSLSQPEACVPAAGLASKSAVELLSKFTNGAHMQFLKKGLMIASATAALAGIAIVSVGAQQGADFFKQTDANHDGYITRDELKAAMATWLAGRQRVTQDQLSSALEAAFPESTFMGMISPPQNRTPKPADVEKMMAALPTVAPAQPAKPRKVLVLCTCAGFVHSCIPLAAKTIESLGQKTGAWTTTVSYDASVITAQNLKQYDAVFLNNTTGFFLDDADPAVTAARKKALLDFVRSGKGLAGIHAASDSYHQSTKGPEFIGMVANGIFGAADQNEDKSVDAQEMNALGDKWFDLIDTAKAGKVSAQDFRAGFPRLLFSSPGARRSGPPTPPAAKAGPDFQVGTWPDFNRMIGGFFKYHWLDPQHIVYKIDDRGSPLTAMFVDGFEVNDETYTFGVKTWSRENLHILTSIDYSKMSEADKLKEDYPREDHDYGLSWIRREGKGRVFYSAHGHSERVYAIRPMLEHVLAGVQYALGDLKANDAPSVKPKK